MSDFDSNKKIKLMPLPYIGMFDLDLIYQASDVELLYQILSKVNEIAQSQNIIIDNFEKILEWAQSQIENYTKEQLQEWLADGTLENMIMSLGQIVKYFDTTEEMLQSQNLQVGQVIKTLGYYNINDGGGCLFIIEDNINLNRLQIKLNNNLYATYLIKNYIDIRQYGCIGDGTFDNTSLLNDIFSKFTNINIDYVYIPYGHYLVTNKLTLPSSIVIKGSQESTYRAASTIIADFGNNEYSLINTNPSKGIIFECINFTRRRTSNDGYPSNLFATGKTGICVDIGSNETQFVNCTFVGWGTVCLNAGITNFIRCNFIYNHIIIKNTVICNNVILEECNLYENDDLIHSYANIQNLVFSNSWIEAYSSILVQKVATYNHFINISCSTLTNRDGNDMIRFEFEEETVYSQLYINFITSITYIRGNISNKSIRNTSSKIVFNDSRIYISGSNPYNLYIYGNSPFYNLNGSDKNTLINKGINALTSEANNGIILANIAPTGSYITRQEDSIRMRDSKNNLIGNIPTFLKSESGVSTPKPIDTKYLTYFIHNVGAVNANDYIVALYNNGKMRVLLKVE